MSDLDFLQPAGTVPEVPPDRLPCPRCNGLGHVDPSRVKGACLGTYWDMTVEPPIERICGQPVPDREHGRAGRRCSECRRQGTRLAELGRAER